MNTLTQHTYFPDQPAYLTKSEFWIATAVFVLALIFLSTSDPGIVLFVKEKYPFSFFRNYFVPQLIQSSYLYGCFLLLNFRVIPKLFKQEQLILNIGLLVLCLAITGLVFGVTGTYTKSYLFNRYATERQAYEVIFVQGFRHAFWLLLITGLYTIIKKTGLYLLLNAEAIQARFNMLNRDGLIAFVGWMMAVFLLVVFQAEEDLTIFLIVTGPPAIAFYCYAFTYLIPDCLQKKHPFRSYLIKAFITLFFVFVPVALVSFAVSQDPEMSISISVFNSFIHFFITVPLTWLLFKQRLKGEEKLYVLKKELGKSNANLDFLRSQINPHFLFNALNTLYGTALQENAERTGEGIQKLGDMMRFMLQENVQEKISLAREIEYLNNYISLQQLRTAPHANVRIQIDIAEQVGTLQIPPMLLIPFVENAFKHGISFREPSHIGVTLEVKSNTLYFDVHNSRNEKQANDPEKSRSGIGLNNVKQRLQLFYPGNHELIIRETGKDFFVHLTLQVA